MVFRVLDATAFYAGIPFSSQDSYYVTTMVYDEIKHIKKNHNALEILLDSKRLVIHDPDITSEEKVRYTAKETGDLQSLSNEDISVHLKNEFNNLNDIDYVDGSLISNTIVLQVDEQTFNKSKVEKMLNRWGLKIEEYAFVSLAPSSINE